MSVLITCFLVLKAGAGAVSSFDSLSLAWDSMSRIEISSSLAVLSASPAIDEAEEDEILDTGFGEALGLILGREVGDPDKESNLLARGRILDDGLSDILYLRNRKGKKKLVCEN